MANYSLWLLEYARIPAQPLSCMLLGQHNRGTRELPFSYLAVVGEGHVVLVDVGTDNNDPVQREMCRRDGVQDWQPPAKTLAKIGLSPGRVDTVILTHAHFDHVGNTAAFPNATFYLQRRELAGWSWVASLPAKYGAMRMAFNPADLDAVRRLVAERRMVLVDGPRTDLLPGIGLYPAYNGHTFASQMVTIESTPGGTTERWVAVGDLAYARQSFTGVEQGGGYVPPGVAVGSPYNMLVTLDEILSRAAGRLDRIIIGHDADTWEMYPSWTGDDGLHVAELALAPGQHSWRPLP
jgi:N-acyl homoserine lactone hydrolase